MRSFTFGTFADRPGEKLPNGSVIIDEQVYLEPDDPENKDEIRRSIVLCLIPTGPNPAPAGYDAFATWDRWVSISPTGTGGKQIVDTCMWGHYFENITHACIEHDNRLREKGK